MKTLSGQYVEAINVANTPAGMRGFIEYCDLAGRMYVKWNNATEGVIRERGDVYKFITIKNKPKKLFWNLRRIILFLLRK
jgi:hypothetical protein